MIDHKYYDQKLAEMPPEFRRKAVEFLKGYISNQDKEAIRRSHAANPESWWAGHHFRWGMGVRNALRKAGLNDDELPDKNWDDYYIQCVEIAVGVRRERD